MINSTLLSSSSKPERFPVLMISNETGLVILAKSFYGDYVSGVVLNSGKTSMNIGDTLVRGVKEYFVDYDGKITLENK